MTAAPVRHCLGLRRQRIKQKATEPAAKAIPSISIPTTSRPHLCLCIQPKYDLGMKASKAVSITPAWVLNGGLIVTGSSLAVFHRDLIIVLCGTAQAARGLRRALFRRRRRPDLLWT